MHGMDAIPSYLVTQLGNRIRGNKMGPVTLTPPVDERISDLAERTAAIGEKFLLAHGARLDGEAFVFAPETPVPQPAELFRLSDLTRYWNADWKLERAGFGGAGGGLGGIRGITYLDGDVLATYPRDEVRGCLLTRRVKLGPEPRLSLEAGSDPSRAWELNVYADNKLLKKTLIEGGADERSWRTLEVDLRPFADREVVLRLYQRVLIRNRTAGNAYWRNLKVQ